MPDRRLTLITIHKSFQFARLNRPNHLNETSACWKMMLSQIVDRYKRIARWCMHTLNPQATERFNIDQPFFAGIGLAAVEFQNPSCDQLPHTLKIDV